MPAVPTPPTDRVHVVHRGRRRAAHRALVVAVAIGVAVVLLAVLVAIDVGRAVDAAGAPSPERSELYRPPVDAPIIDPFRAPTTPYGPGNRGLDYGVAPGTIVRAMAQGEVIFAGPVAGTLHVTIVHADGLRSSYSFLALVSVHVGQHVAIGEAIGLSTEVLHVGVRDPAGTYLDPALLFEAPRHAHLVPGGDDGTDAPGRTGERSDLASIVTERAGPLAALLTNGQPNAPDLMARVRLWRQVVTEADWATHVPRIAERLHQWWADRGDCTAPNVAAPAAGAGRILIEVGGIGSTSESAAVADVDAGVLGYHDADVIRFSYRGGRVPGDSGRDVPVAVSAYDAADSQQPLASSADALATLLRDVAAARPGVPIDVVAHSQGGIVARAAVADSAASGQLPPEVAHLVTVASPHQGADAAGAVILGQQSSIGLQVEIEVQDRLGLALDGRSPATRDLAPGSTLLAHLDDNEWPSSVRFTSIAARGDLVVPSPRTEAAGARSVTVDLTGPRAHGDAPGAPATQRELALAMAGAPPTCRGLTDTVADLATGELVALSEARASVVAAVTLSAGGQP